MSAVGRIVTALDALVHDLVEGGADEHAVWVELALYGAGRADETKQQLQLQEGENR